MQDSRAYSMPAETKLEEYNPGTVPWRGGQTIIAGKQRSVQGFGKCNIDGAMGGEIAAELPNPRKQKAMVVTIYGQICKIVDHLLSP